MRGGARVQQLGEAVRRAFDLDATAELPYVCWRNGSVAHLEARHEGTCTLTVAGPAFGEAFVAVLLHEGMSGLGAAMMAH